MAGVIVHEWISRTGGSEKVLDAMVEAFPDAEVWCLWNDVPKLRYPNATVRESWLAHTPLRRVKPAALPFMPTTWRTHRKVPAEWVLASSHLFAHHVSLGRANPDVRKFAYVYTPARYIWNPELDKRGIGWLPRLASPSLRALDRRRAQESYRIAAISEYVRERIQTAWQRDSTVIYPPVDVPGLQRIPWWPDVLDDSERMILEQIPRPFVLGASRFVAYKRLDEVISAGEAAGMPVVLAGSGPEEERLRGQAAEAEVPVHFVTDPSDALLYALYQLAAVFVFPAVEDFGLMPVEAMALGTPVVVNSVGGTTETVIDGMTGAHLAPGDSPRDYRAAIDRALSCAPDDCRTRAGAFAADRFDSELKDWLGTGCIRTR